MRVCLKAWTYEDEDEEEEERRRMVVALTVEFILDSFGYSL